MRVRSTKSFAIDSEKFKKAIEKKGYYQAELSRVIGCNRNYISECIHVGKIGTKQLAELEKRCGFKRDDFLAKDGQYSLDLNGPATAAGVYEVPKVSSAITEHIGNIAAELEKLKEDLEKWQEAQYNLK